MALNVDLLHLAALRGADDGQFLAVGAQAPAHRRFHRAVRAFLRRLDDALGAARLRVALRLTTLALVHFPGAVQL